MFDVAIIGAGPAGSMAARLLADKGYATALIEEHSLPGDAVNCSGVIGTEAFERFDLPRDVILREIDCFRFLSPSGNTLDYQHSAPLAVAVDRARFDLKLAQKAVTAGAALLINSRVSRIETGNDHVQLTIGTDKILRSKFMILATGAGSKLTHQVGLATSQSYVLGAQTECDIRDVEQVEIHLGRNIAPSNFGWVIPLQPGRAKVGLMCEANAPQSLRNFLQTPALMERIVCSSKFKISLLPLETLSRTYAHRALVVGEAAGQIKTITCGGIYYALRAAEIAVGVLDQALQSTADVLPSYEHRWKELFGRELRTGRRLRSLFRRFSDDQIEFLFRMARKDGLMNLIRRKAHFDWHHDLVTAVLRHSLFQAIQQPALATRLFC